MENRTHGMLSGTSDRTANTSKNEGQGGVSVDMLQVRVIKVAQT